jgi:hypothetical protein
MDSDIAAVFRGGPFDGRLDTIPATRQPRYFDTRDGGWVLYVLTDDDEGGRRVLRYEHGSSDAA